MKTQVSAVRRALRAVPKAARGAHHQIASRALRDAVKFAAVDAAHAADALRLARFHVQFVGAV